MSTDWIRPDWPAPRNVRALSTTRAGGVSRGAWASLNLGSGCGDRPASVRENRRRLASLLPSEPRWLRQVHGREVLRLGDAPGGAVEADAAVARQAGMVCAVLHADCLPVLLCTADGQRVAAAHAGWRGLAAGVLEATVAAMGADPSDLLAWLGPCIGAGAYEVGGEVRAAFTAEDAGAEGGFRARGERWLADLRWLARRRLGHAGVDAVFASQDCTLSDPERFYSYRRDGRTGRMATLIWRH